MQTVFGKPGGHFAMIAGKTTETLLSWKATSQSSHLIFSSMRQPTLVVPQHRETSLSGCISCFYKFSLTAL
ncbi:hypothetical protein ACHAXS_008374, partial [Conticribra weissflogii]